MSWEPVCTACAGEAAVHAAAAWAKSPAPCAVHQPQLSGEEAARPAAGRARAPAAGAVGDRRNTARAPVPACRRSAGPGRPTARGRSAGADGAWARQAAAATAGGRCSRSRGRCRSRRMGALRAPAHAPTTLATVRCGGAAQLASNAAAPARGRHREGATLDTGHEGFESSTAAAPARVPVCQPPDRAAVASSVAAGCAALALVVAAGSAPARAPLRGPGRRRRPGRARGPSPHRRYAGPLHGACARPGHARSGCLVLVCRPAGGPHRPRGAIDEVVVGWLSPTGQVMVESDRSLTGRPVRWTSSHTYADDHNSPRPLGRARQPHHRLLVSPQRPPSLLQDHACARVTSRHGGTGNSSHPTHRAAWGFTYPNPVILPAEGNRHYLFWRGGDWEPSFSTRTARRDLGPRPRARSMHPAAGRT